jgi:cell division protein FtsL
MNILAIILVVLVITYIIQSISYINAQRSCNMFRKEMGDNISDWKKSIEEYKKHINDLQDKIYHLSREKDEENYTIQFATKNKKKLSKK